MRASYGTAQTLTERIPELVKAVMRAGARSPRSLDERNSAESESRPPAPRLEQLAHQREQVNGRGRDAGRPAPVPGGRHRGRRGKPAAATATLTSIRKGAAAGVEMPRNKMSAQNLREKKSSRNITSTSTISAANASRSLR